MNWKPRPLSELEQAIDRLRVENIKLRREVETKQTQVGGLKLALQQLERANRPTSRPGRSGAGAMPPLG